MMHYFSILPTIERFARKNGRFSGGRVETSARRFNLERLSSIRAENARIDPSNHLKWMARADREGERSQAAAILADKQPERRWQVWVRVHLGGERRIDIARAFGYKDGSAITHILNRLQTEARSKPATARRTSRLETEIGPIMATFKHWPLPPTFPPNQDE